ncbi:hybrid sensor histidine kinase/response regulator [Labrenzia sp. PHM005]|uniref:hybrid sensor histidine kinase/response regulator n=1 Tax=Labrenzia sp. PHM005 TaxID=2590016 RepID=UPI0011408B48|nr:PAS domain S-box protein [Labrenzia sp. PHM005]
MPHNDLQLPKTSDNAARPDATDHPPALISALSEPDALIYWWVDIAYRKVQYSRSFCRQIGVQRDTLKSDPNAWQPYVHPQNLEELNNTLKSLRKDFVEEKTLQIRFWGPGGEWQWFKTRIRKVHNPTKHDRPFGLILFQDITAEKRAEMMLKDQSSQLAHALNNARQAVWDRDFRTGKTFYSRAWSEMLGYRPEDITDDPNMWQTLMHPDDLPDVLAADRAHLNGQTERFRQEFRMRHKDGHWVWILDRGQVVERDGQGNPLRMIGTHADITQRVETHAALEASQRKAEQAAQAKSDFLSNMSHELRTPLTSILGVSDLLLEELRGVLADQYISALTMQKEAGAGLLAIVNDILDFTKIEAGDLPIEDTPFCLPEQVATVLDLVEKIAENKGVSVHLKITDSSLDHVTGDPFRTRQVLINLVSNAIKFTPSGGLVTVSIRQKPEGIVEFQVADTGIGIAPDVIPNLFKRFTQADTSTTRQYGGSGLGLAISHRLVELMGGHIDVESTPNEGSVFTFEIPLAKAEPVTAPSQDTVPTIHCEEKLDGIRVLLAEDNEVNQALIKSRLEKSGATVHAVSNGLDAVDAAKTETFDVILMDIQMPIMDGMEASQAIKQDSVQPDCPILALTANVYAQKKATKDGIPIDAWLTKPVDWSLLISSIAKLRGNGQLDETPNAAGDDTINGEKQTDENGSASLTQEAEADNNPQLKEMLDLVGAEETLRLAQVFEEELKTRLEVVQAERENPAELSRQVHALASAAYSFGFIALSDCCRKIMALCENTDPDLASTLDEFDALASQTLLSISRISNQLSTAE